MARSFGPHVRSDRRRRDDGDDPVRCRQSDFSVLGRVQDGILSGGRTPADHYDTLLPPELDQLRICTSTIPTE